MTFPIENNFNMTNSIPMFKLFNTEALLNSDCQSLMAGAEGSFLNFPESISFEEPIPTGPKKRGRKKKVVLAKDNFAPTITIKEIIENDKFGSPMEAEKLLNEQKSKKLREMRAKKDFKAVELHPQESSSSQGTASQAEEVPFTGAPTLKIIDGKIVLEDNIAALPSLKDKAHELAVSKPKTLNSMSFRTKTQSKKWTEEEDNLFYKLLGMFGPDFSMMALVFETRTRNELKNKFNREDRLNCAKVDQALGRTKKYVKALEGRFSAQAQARALADTCEMPTQATNERAEATETELWAVPTIRNTSSTSSIDTVEMNIFRKINSMLDKDQSEIELDEFKPAAIVQERKEKTSTNDVNRASFSLERAEPRIEKEVTSTKLRMEPVSAIVEANTDAIQEIELEKTTCETGKPRNLFFS